jgi:hypothetical protein
MTYPLNLNRVVNWQQLLPVLEIDYGPGILPCRVLCPFCCKPTLTIYNDSLFGGVWTHCKTCQKAGDAIELAAGVWGLTAQQTLLKLHQELPECFPEPVDRYYIGLYEIEVVNRRLQAKEFWHECSYRMIDRKGLQQLRLSDQFIAHIDPQLWSKRGGQWYGAANRHQLATYLSHYGRVFRGTRLSNLDTDCVVFPFQDLPGRLSAFLFCHGEQYNLTPISYLSLGQFGDRRRKAGKTKGTGILVPEALENTDEAYILLDCPLVLRTHIKWLHLDSRLLPVSGIWGEAPSPGWFSVTGSCRKYIFWDHLWNPALFRHARAVDGLVAAPSSSVAATYDLLKHVSPQEWLTKLKKHARPWRDALEEHLGTLGANEAEGFLLDIGWTPTETNSFLLDLPPTLRDKLMKLTERRRCRSVSIDNLVVKETDRGWILPNGELLCDAPYAIEQIIEGPNPKVTRCTGRIWYQGEDIPFDCYQGRMEGSPNRWLADTMLKAGKGPPIVSHKHRTYLTAVSKLFHPPTIVSALDHYGWAAEESHYVLPTCYIKPGGRVVRHDLLLKQRPHYYAATGLDVPEPFTKDDWDYLLKPTEETRLAWPVLATVLNTLLAQPLHRNRVGLLVVGDGLATAVDLAVAAGCAAEWSTAIKRAGAHVALVVNRITDDTDWPVVFPYEAPHSPRLHHWLERGHRPTIIGVNWYAARLLQLTGDWLRLDTAKAVKLSPRIKELVRKSVPLFLQNAMTMRLNIQSGGVWSALEGWLSSLLLQKERLAPFQTLVTSEDKLGTLEELLGQLWRDGLLRSSQYDESLTRYRAKDVAVSSEWVWLSRPGLNKALGIPYLPVLNFESVVGILTAAGVLVDERVYLGVPGWTVRKEWWTKVTEGR